MVLSASTEPMISASLPVPTLWLLGRAQSGKSSIIRALTGCDQATIGNGYVPCTQSTQIFDFPPGASPAMRFLDTRGFDDPSYDPHEDIEACNDQSHMIVVVMRVTDRAQARVIEILDKLKQKRPRMPVLHVLTCLHEGYPGRNHPNPYPFAGPAPWSCPDLNLDGFNQLVRLQVEAMGNRADRTVLVDITPPDFGLNPCDYGVESLRENLLDLLPATLRNGLADLAGGGTDRAIDAVIQRHAWIAAATGGVPIPGVDLVGVTVVQARMVSELGRLLRVPGGSEFFMRMTGPLLLATIGRRTATSLIKLIPIVGSVVGALSGAAINGISTVALGKLFVWYSRTGSEGSRPTAEEVAAEYERRFAEAARVWKGDS